ncbi:MAG: hypothetical protein ACTS6A_03170 [Candidatus Hodgkinia cicadicola]
MDKIKCKSYIIRVLGLCLQILSGISVAVNYEPSAMLAFHCLNRTARYTSSDGYLEFVTILELHWHLELCTRICSKMFIVDRIRLVDKAHELLELYHLC